MIVLIIWNIATFLTYGADKHRAKNGLWRIPEKVLLAEAFFMGAPGAILGMQIFRHKTRKPKFQILIPLFLLLNAAVIFAIYKDSFTR